MEELLEIVGHGFLGVVVPDSLGIRSESLGGVEVF